MRKVRVELSTEQILAAIEKYKEHRATITPEEVAKDRRIARRKYGPGVVVENVLSGETFTT